MQRVRNILLLIRQTARDLNCHREGVSYTLRNGEKALTTQQKTQKAKINQKPPV